MTPWKLEHFIQKCGSWMYSADQNFSKNHPSEERLWFTPPVLTPDNPDKNNPQIPIEDARDVFALLEKRGLFFRRTIEAAVGEGAKRSVEVFFVNRDRTRDWEKLVSKRGIWNMNASPFFHYFIVERWGWLVIIFVLGAFATKFFQDLASDVYKVSLGKVFQIQGQSTNSVNKVK